MNKCWKSSLHHLGSYLLCYVIKCYPQNVVIVLVTRYIKKKKKFWWFSSHELWFILELNTIQIWLDVVPRSKFQLKLELAQHVIVTGLLLSSSFCTRSSWECTYFYLHFCISFLWRFLVQQKNNAHTNHSFCSAVHCLQ